tara:strand:- start:13776 stop:15674 length:1899 start_codon:yes stop_codon:yes gene_type:complete
MVPLLGNLSLWLGLILSALQFTNSVKKKYHLNSTNNKIIVKGLFFSIMLSFISLMYCYVTSDFSVANVYQNSHTSKPLIYKISAVWGNHEGSMLLWLLVLCIFNYLIFKLFDEKNSSFIFKSLEIQSIIIFGFLLFTLLTSNPFEQIIPTPENGLGFNPVLQDPALAIHPPLLYVGYVGFSAVFSMAIATLTSEDNQKIIWYSYMKPFVLISWTFLTIGIAFGSLWAYYELGWGGWWFWDPVENASFMPWLLGTALLHSLITVEKKQSLKTWVLLLALLTFILSTTGTFLVRSGILTSVHAFALDPDRGIFILVFITLLSSYALFIFGKYSKKFYSNNYFTFFSKEGSILINNIIMVIVCATVFLGTVYPLVVEAFLNKKISVGEPYYNTVIVPMMFPAIIIMGLASSLSWGKDKILKVMKENFLSIVLTILSSLMFLYLYKLRNIVGVVGVFLAFWIIVNNLIALAQMKKLKVFKSMIIAHLGLGFLILGITASSIWQEEKIVRMKINDNTKLQKYNIIFQKIDEVVGKNFVAIQGKFSIYNDEKKIIAELKPENRFYPVTKNMTSEASIHTNILRDLYIVIGDGNLKDGWVVRLYYNPLVMFIWIGAFFIFLAGLVAIYTNFRKIKLIKI